MKNTFTLKELAAYLNVSERTIYRMIDEGRMPVKPLEGFKNPRWSVAKIDAWMKGGDE